MVVEHMWVSENECDGLKPQQSNCHFNSNKCQTYFQVIDLFWVCKISIIKDLSKLGVISFKLSIFNSYF